MGSSYAVVKSVFAFSPYHPISPSSSLGRFSVRLSGSREVANSNYRVFLPRTGSARFCRQSGPARHQKSKKTAQASSAEAESTSDQNNEKRVHFSNACPRSQKRELSQSYNAEAGPSSHHVSRSVVAQTVGQDLLIIPPISRDILERLTSMLANVISIDASATDPGTKEDEVERRERAQKRSICMMYIKVFMYMYSE